MRIFVALLGMLSLLGMQIHAFAPHHHHDDLFASAHSHEVSAVHIHEHELGDSHQNELTSDHHHHHWHEHSDDVGTKPPRSNRGAPDVVGILATPLIFNFSTECSVPSRVCHPFIPFQTGPPGFFSSRGPPVA